MAQFRPHRNHIWEKYAMICSVAAECSSSRNLGFLRRIRSLGHSLRHLTFVRTVIAFGFYFTYCNM